MQYNIGVSRPSVPQLRAICIRFPTEVAFEFYQTVSYWRERARQRRRLMQLPDDRLRDIGISRLDAIREAQKSFWQT